MVYCFFVAQILEERTKKMKNIDEKILMAEEEIKQLQNKKPSTKCCALPSPAPKSWSQTKPPTSSNNNTKKSYSRVTTSKTPISTWHKSKTTFPKPYRKRKRDCCGTTAFTALPSANLFEIVATPVFFSDGLQPRKGRLKTEPFQAWTLIVHMPFAFGKPQPA